MNKQIIVLVVAVVALGAAFWYVRMNNVASVAETEQETQSPPTTNTNTKPTPKPGTKPATNTPATTQKVTYKNASTSDIVVTAPQPGATIKDASFIVSGKARGGWYFEANFPLELRGSDGKVIAQVPVQAQGDWMTPEFVSFYLRVTTPLGYKGPATLILRNDNPSGLAENDKSISIPLVIE